MEQEVCALFLAFIFRYFGPIPDARSLDTWQRIDRKRLDVDQGTLARDGAFARRS